MNLSGNRIQKLADSLKELNLKELNWSDNKITKLPVFVISALEPSGKLMISGNPLDKMTREKLQSIDRISSEIEIKF